MADTPERDLPETLRARRCVVPTMTVSTVGLPNGQQYEAWQSLGVPFLEMRPRESERPSAFHGIGVARRFGPLLLYRLEMDPLDQRRTPAQVRRDGLDHWVVAICRRGHHRHHLDHGHSVTLRPGAPYVLSMLQPFRAQRDGEVVDWVSLYVPRDSVPHLASALEARLGQPLEGPLGAILAEHILALDEHLDEVTEAEAPRLAAATLSLLDAAVTGLEAACDRPRLDQIRLTRVKALIRRNLGSATLSPGRLATMAGMSRSQLYRVFEPLGGVAGFIQRERLRFAFDLLTRQDGATPINRIAERAGFFEPSSFSRAFRQAFGVTPRDVRSAAMAGTPVPGRDEALGEGRILELLQGL